MDGSSFFLFDDSESPILNNMLKNFNPVQTSSNDNFSLESIHNRLLQHMKKKENIPRKELRTLLDQINKINPESVRNKWLLTKVRGLLTCTLKRRADFQGANFKGEITIPDKSLSQPDTTVCEIPEPPQFHSQPGTSCSGFASEFLTNNNFVTCDSQAKPMEVVNTYDCSEDLFSDGVATLHDLSQQNYHLLKSLTKKTPIEEDLIATDQIDKVFQAHDNVEHNYALLNSKMEAVARNSSGSYNLFSDSESQNLFDNLTISNDEFNQEFEQMLKQTESWVAGIVDDLVRLEVDDSAPFTNTKVQEPESASTSLVTVHSEENLKIIREVQNEFKKKLMDYMKDKEKADILRSLFGSF